MVKYTLIIEYLSKGNNFSQVATLCGCSRTTVILQNRPNQKLFAVLTGQTIADDEDEDKEGELNFNRDNDKNAPAIELGNDLKLPPPIIFSLLSLTNAIGQFMASGNLSLIILERKRLLQKKIV